MAPKTTVFFPMVLIAGVSCDRIIGIEPLPPSSVVYAVERCGACSADRCTTEVDACLDDDACTAWLSCVAGCDRDDSDCRYGCEVASPGAYDSASVLALDVCRRASCADGCLGSRVPYFRHGYDDACASCIDQACGDEQLACIIDASCERGHGCARSCDDPNCALRCLGEVGGSVRGPLVDYRSCVTSKCSVECEIGQLHACVGDYAWEAPEDKDALFPYTVVVDRLDANGITSAAVGVEVIACGQLHGDCVPQSRGITDEEGRAALELGSGVAGFLGRFDAVGDDLIPTAFYPGRPILRTEDFSGFTMTTEDTIVALGGALDVAHVGVRVHDCTYTPSTDLRVHLDAEAHGPNTTVLATQLPGFFVVLNVLPGTWTAYQTLADGTPNGETSFEARAGETTQVIVVPSTTR